MAHHSVHALAVLAAESGLAQTGRTIPFLAAGVAVGVALLLRAGVSRLDDRGGDTGGEPAVSDDDQD